MGLDLLPQNMLHCVIDWRKYQEPNFCGGFYSCFSSLFPPTACNIHSQSLLQTPLHTQAHTHNHNHTHNHIHTNNHIHTITHMIHNTFRIRLSALITWFLVLKYEFPRYSIGVIVLCQRKEAYNMKQNKSRFHLPLLGSSQLQQALGL